MVHCAKCGAELIGLQKFCAACGAPAGNPRSPAASTGQTPATSGQAPGAPGSAPASAPGGSGPSIQYAPAPTSKVNPFAQTAGPAHTARASDYGPPPASLPAELGATTPGVGNPLSAPQVSPLAVSNALSQRGAFENAMTAGPAEAAAAAVGLFPVPAQPPSAPAQNSLRSGVPGTQLMPSMANPPSHGGAPAGATPASGAPAPVGSKRPDRTQLLGAIPAGTIPRPGAPAPAPTPLPAPSSGMPSALPAPGSAPSASRQPVMQPVPQPPPPPPQMPVAPQPPVAAPQQFQAPVPPWNPPPPQPFPHHAPPAPAPIPYAAAPYPQQPQPPTAPPMQGQPPQAAGGYVFGYVPGSRVTVTWSNGQRYPGTVQQVSGSQCLVVFPDGQHHWVDMQYVAPA